MRIWLIANHAIPWATGSDLARTLEGMGVDVVRLQDEDLAGWEQLVLEIAMGTKVDVVLWNATPALSGRIPVELRTQMQYEAREAGIPTVAFHLDRWWGLRRQHEVYTDPFFRCQYVFTADGHPSNRWREAGVNHHWLPPGVAPFHCYRSAHYRRDYDLELAFVGSWRHYGHHEWTHRDNLIRHLKRTYQLRVGFWPRRGHTPVREAELNDLYANTKVIVGDSCLVPDRGGRPYTNFCSDRVPETLGRGGFLIHPAVEGITFGSGALYDDRHHLATWEWGNWGQLSHEIDRFLADDTERKRRAAAGQRHVAAHHTYDVRMMDVFDQVLDEMPEGVHLWHSTMRARGCDGEIDDQAPQAAAQKPVRAARKKGVPDAGQGSRPKRQSKSKPDVQARPLVEVLAGPDQREGEPDPGEGTQPKALSE